jgi:hypothetical protein
MDDPRGLSQAFRSMYFKLKLAEDLGSSNIAYIGRQSDQTYQTVSTVRVDF